LHKFGSLPSRREQCEQGQWFSSDLLSIVLHPPNFCRFSMENRGNHRRDKTVTHRILHFFKRHVADEDGAVTVDWVVLVSAIIGLAIPIIALIYKGMGLTAANIDSTLATISIVTN
tara:strand:- start:48230 stop:48577 length:348 start_codon:yes stop_codon:yes gene_type:complete